jgi:DNA-binding MarR family transcriptional regulator
MAARRITQIYESALAPSHLTITQFAILGELETRKATLLTMAELAETLVMDRSSLGHTLRPLERDQLVRFVLNREDKRTKLVEMTPSGLDRFRKAHRLWRRAQIYFEAAFGKQSAADLRLVLGFVASLDLPPQAS